MPCAEKKTFIHLIFQNLKFYGYTHTLLGTKLVVFLRIKMKYLVYNDQMKGSGIGIEKPSKSFLIYSI